MRTFEWGKASSHDADFSGRLIKSESLAVWGNGRDFDGGGSTVSGLIDLAQNRSVNGVPGAQIAFVNVALDNIRARIGSSPVILAAYFRAVLHEQYVAQTTSYPLRRVFAAVDMSAATGRYMSSGVPWTDDVYAPMPGTDVADSDYSSAQATTVDSSYYPLGSTFEAALSWEVTDLLQEALAANGDLNFVLWKPSNSQYGTFNWNYEGLRRYLQIYYLYRIEFYGVDSAGDLDPTKRWNSISGDLSSQLALGSVARGQTSTPVAMILKNFGSDMLSLVELWDDSPEWSDPVQSTGTGTGALGYVSLADTAISQKYTVVFSSATNYEVKAEGYRDQPTGLHPSIDSDASWQGDTSSDWTAPSGGLTLPSAAWSAGTLVGDEFVVYVVGQTTLSSWPSDSNTQVECCLDDGAGSPDGDWRPILGQRTKLTAGVTIDATSKTISVRHIDTTLWDVGDKIWIGDGTNLDEGTISSRSATSITIGGLTAGSHTYAAGARVGTTLPIQSLGTTTVTTVDQDSGASYSPASRLYVADTTGFSAGNSIVIEKLDDGTILEEATIQTVSSSGGYLDLTANMTLDWSSGDVVYVKGSGEQKVWLRVTASSTSVEELKQFRLSVRT